MLWHKLEVTIYTLVFALPLLFDWIPFITNSYGPSQNFCWFRSNSSEHWSYNAGLWEEIWLSAATLGVVVFLILLLFTASLCQLCYGIKNAQVDRRAVIEVGVTNSIFFIAFFINASVLLPFHGFFSASLKIPQYTVILAPIAIWCCFLSLFWWQSIYPSLRLHNCVSSIHNTVIYQENATKQLYTRAATGNNPVTQVGLLHTVSMSILKLHLLSDICKNTMNGHYRILDYVTV